VSSYRLQGTNFDSSYSHENEKRDFTDRVRRSDSVWPFGSGDDRNPIPPGLATVALDPIGSTSEGFLVLASRESGSVLEYSVHSA